MKFKHFWIRYAGPLLIIIIILLTLSARIHGYSSSSLYDLESFKQRTPITYPGSFNVDFNDLNDVQLKVAQKIGISPISSRNTTPLPSVLQEITSCKAYTIARLTHSIPFLIPTAAKLLTDIGETFQTHLTNHNLPLYRIIVTSVTRTEADIASLRKKNVNASSQSTHAYGTTFDISWRRFEKVNPIDPRHLSPEELKHLLATVLKEFQTEKRCYIKHERKQACFHITTRQ